MKRITVEILCMVTDSDGTPVNANGDIISGRQKPWFEWDKRRISVNKFCPPDLSNPKRRTVQYLDTKTAEPLRCNCHQGKMRLMQ